MHLRRVRHKPQRFLIVGQRLGLPAGHRGKQRAEIEMRPPVAWVQSKGFLEVLDRVGLPSGNLR